MVSGKTFANSSTEKRVKFLVIFFFLLGALLLWRLFHWQIVAAGELAGIAKSQQQVRTKVPAKRGSILASDNFPLVSSKQSFLLWAQPKKISEPEKIAKALAPLLISDYEETEASPSGRTQGEIITDEEERIKEVLAKKDAAWVPVKRKVSRETKSKIEALGIANVGFDEEEDRSYPEGSMSAHLLGFVGKDAAGEDRGYFGLEGYYDLTLSGASGKKTWEKDALGNPILLGDFWEISALDGATLKTHIDRSIQFIAEKHLKEGLEKYGASRGMVVVARPQDGAILAMASLPAYSPSRFTLFKQEEFINPVIGESFEPGSIFKVLVMSAALDAGVVTADEKCDACSGPRRIGEYTIKTWNEKYYPDSTATEIIEHSDNIGMVWTAEKLGRDKLLEYLDKFGIGKATNIDLQGEAAPALRDKDKWASIDLATAGFGQGIAVTAIQMVRAVGAIANGGMLAAPQVVDKVITQIKEHDVPPQLGEQVISKETAGKITEMMIKAIENGEAKWAKPKGFKVAGKTGTAQIPIAGHYDPEKTIASFIGFASPSNPKFVMLVSLWEPKSSPWGSETAAPLWFSIARDLFPYMGIKPEGGVGG
ncbi:MAG: penicillin-binding protein 2 [Candidatus Blackburnbacteria bacterium]|nr:penicillin-binding protein 2 [Candidatus Blackburnbacteria bacterium]